MGVAAAHGEGGSEKKKRQRERAAQYRMAKNLNHHGHDERKRHEQVAHRKGILGVEQPVAQGLSAKARGEGCGSGFDPAGPGEPELPGGNDNQHQDGQPVHQDKEGMEAKAVVNGSAHGANPEKNEGLANPAKFATRSAQCARPVKCKGHEHGG